MKSRPLPRTVICAPVLMRFGAFLVDYVLIGSIFFGIYYLLGRAPASYQGFRISANSLPCFLVMWLYFAVMESSKLQASLGKLLFRQRVCDYRFERISFSRALLRYLSRAVLGVCLFGMMWSHNIQGLHDYLTKSLVLEKRDLAIHIRNRDRARAARQSQEKNVSDEEPPLSISTETTSH